MHGLHNIIFSNCKRVHRSFPTSNYQTYFYGHIKNYFKMQKFKYLQKQIDLKMKTIIMNNCKNYD